MAKQRPDIVRAKSFMGPVLGLKNAFRDLEAKMWDGEVVECLASGQFGKLPGVIALTNQRILLVANTLGASQASHYLLEDVRDIEQSGDLMHGSITVHTAGSSTTLTRMNRKESRRFVEAAQRSLSNGARPTPSGDANPADQLLKLKQLHDTGVLTTEQYNEKAAPLIEQL